MDFPAAARRADQFVMIESSTWEGGDFGPQVPWGAVQKGAFCNYTISDHHLVCTDLKSGEVFLDTTDVFSGKGPYRNDPFYQCKVDFGPLPGGPYRISGPPFTWSNGTQNAMALLPQGYPCGRSNLFMHQGVLSTGCLVFGNQAGLASIAARGGGWLFVRPGAFGGF